MSTSTKAGPSRSDRPILEVRQICKSFPGVRVLKSVNLSIWPGEVHAFMGENGAGKSTLMKNLAGAYRPDSGEIFLDDKPIHLRTPHEARLAGIGITQELTVAPNLTVSGNVFLGSELRQLRVHQRHRPNGSENPGSIGPARRKIQSDPARRSSRGRGTTAGRDSRALFYKSRILVMDEPTAALSDRETDRLFEVSANFARKGWPSSTSAIGWLKCTSWPTDSRFSAMENTLVNSSAGLFSRQSHRDDGRTPTGGFLRVRNIRLGR